MKKLASLILAGLFVFSLIVPAGNLFAAEEEDTKEMQMQEEENPAYEKEYEDLMKQEEMDTEKGAAEEEQNPSDEEKEKSDEK